MKFISSLTQFNLVIPLIAFLPFLVGDPIKKICLTKFKAEMEQARKIPPDGMGRFTCQCFIDNFRKVGSISSAKSICKKLAAEKYDY